MAIKINNSLINGIPKVGTDGLSCSIDDNNLDNVLDTGFYYGNRMTNGPKEVSSSNNCFGFLIVISHNVSKNYCVQVLFTQGNNANIYLRQKNNTWTSWYKINTTLSS